ncbi:MAG TPA: class I adenylate-forming enzyme family protein, partial [Candidatus Methylacidiphilales bacterium]|nr:class I adenylate-forming enzyme family protein [Candidatus Methylacidiphilales bacterium]
MSASATAKVPRATSSRASLKKSSTKKVHVGAARRCLTPSPFGASLLWHAFQQVAAAHPHAVAVIDAERDWSWTTSQLLKESAALAEILAACAAASGDRIAFCLPNSADWLRLFLGMQRLGMTAVPLDPSLPRDAAVRLEAAHAAGAHWLWEAIHVTPGPNAETVPAYECESYLQFRLVRTSNAVRKRVTARQARPVLVKLTSGSTGVPKQIPCTAGHMLADGRNIISTMEIRPDDINMAVIPLGHSYGLGNLVMPLLIQGTAVVVSREFVPRQLGFWIHRYRATVLPAVPAIFRALAVLSDPCLAPPLRLAISAGGPLSAAIRDAFAATHGIQIHNFYGSSESGGICYDRTGQAALAEGVAGAPLHGVRVSVSATGRIVVESHAVAVGRQAPIRLSNSTEDTAPLDIKLRGEAAPANLYSIHIGDGLSHGRPKRYVLPDLGAWT